MKRFLFAVCLAVTSVNTASAQWFCPPVPPPQPVWCEWYTIPIVITAPEPVWKDVAYCNVRYCLDGLEYVVTENGQHFLLGANVSEQVGHSFVEPFCPVTGERVPRHLSDVPRGARVVGQVGAKTIFDVHGERQIATWVSVGDTIKTVWLRRLIVTHESAPQPTIAPTPDAHFGPALPAPSGTWEEVRPGNRNSVPRYEYESESTSKPLTIPPAPQLELPPPSTPSSVPQRKTQKEPEKVRFKAPVARV